MEPQSAPRGALNAPVSLWRVGAWFFGVMFAIVAVSNISSGNVLVGGLWLLAAGALLPPVAASLLRRGAPLTRGRRIAAAAGLVLLAGSLGSGGDRPAAATLAVARGSAAEVGARASSTGEAPTASSSALAGKPQPQSQAPAAQDQAYYAVTQVVDGDTFKIRKGGAEVTLRLIGIDTPETVDPRKPVQCFGREASAEAKRLLVGQKVRIEADASQDTYDKYGRTLAYAYLEDGTSFNEHMVRQGFAHEYTYDAPYKYQATFKAAQKEAEAAGRGLWAPDACDTATAPTPVPTAPAAATPEPSAPAPSGHTFYTSSHYSARYYYCDSDDGWKQLSATYLRSYPSSAALLAAFPDRTLHEDCR